MRLARWWQGLEAMALVTGREAVRTRLWLPALAAALLLLLWIPALQAADAGEALRLATAAVSGTIGFVSALAAIGVVSSALRRDLDQRQVLVLFSSPLGRGAYLLGRCGGSLTLVALVALGLAIAGAGAIRLRHGPLPEPWTTTPATELWRWEGGRRLDADPQQRLILSGDPARGRGEGLGWRFPAAQLGPDRVLLLRVAARSGSFEDPVGSTRVLLWAEGRAGAVSLPLLEESPYGQGSSDAVVLLDRGGRVGDLTRDYARFSVPDAALAADGGLQLRLQRLDADSRIAVTAVDDLLLARRSGSFTSNLMVAAGTQLAVAGLLIAVAAAVATIAGLPTVLLVSLTVLFAGSALAFVRDDGIDDLPLALRRFSDLLAWTLPDCSAHAPGEALAQGRVIGFDGLLAAWRHLSVHTVLALVLAWLGLRRVEC